ncbi:heme NO-binding domain-containing protein [Alteraurantiacibacter aestuarii]|uniref:Guanylate cyclase n=1 Tax=Alteraurantiacibacter aestuarii TaxID=650004 RepID=A0A844ZNX4_9SPHN|nr:heme NO-binding domain-containing protein [Alteraurantiacibacter aestuarii]MXO88746.1 guanylate cyclase [Alteraurantiacibacter aestuarii]
MKGIIFTELVNFMEEGFGLVFADEVLVEADLPDGGAFTSVGSYPATNALKMVSIASVKSGVPVDELCQKYGSYLFQRFTVLFPDIMKLYTSVDELLDHVGPHIHEEVRILYPGAKPPSVTTRRENGVLVVSYQSHRPLAHIAYGLIRQSIEHYGDERELTWESSKLGDRAEFRLVKAL